MKASGLYTINISSLNIYSSENTNKVTNGSEINFLFSLRPMYYFSRIFGLTPFSIIRNSNDEIQAIHVSKFDLLWFITSMGLYSLMAVICFQTTHSEGSPNLSHVLIIGDRLLLTVCLVSSVIKVIMDMCNRFRLFDILKKLAFFDKEVSKYIIRKE